MPSMQLKVNFKKGWPSPTIVEDTALPDTGVVCGAGMIGHKDITTGKWHLGLTANQVGYIFQNDSDDPDAQRGTTGVSGVTFKPVGWGGVHGIALSNPLEVETIQYTGTPAVGDLLTVASTGLLATAATGNLIVGICTEAPHKIGSSTFITFVPDNSKRLAP